MDITTFIRGNAVEAVLLALLIFALLCVYWQTKCLILDRKLGKMQIELREYRSFYFSCLVKNDNKPIIKEATPMAGRTIFSKSESKVCPKGSISNKPESIIPATTAVTTKQTIAVPLSIAIRAYRGLKCRVNHNREEPAVAIEEMPYN